MSVSHTHDEFIALFSIVKAIGKSLEKKYPTIKDDIKSELENIKKDKSEKVQSEIDSIIETVSSW